MTYGENPRMRVAPILLSRGCPFRCAFCGPHAPYRRRSRAGISAEVRRLRATGYEGLVVVDDLPFLNEEDVVEFCDAVRPLGMRFRCNYRPNLLTSTVATLLKSSGCCRIQVGIESVEAETLRNVGRPNPDLNGRAIQICRDEGLQVKAMFIWGLPGDSEQTAARLVEWVRRYRPDAIQVSLFTLLPGSPLWNGGLCRYLVDYTKAAFFPGLDSDQTGVGNGYMSAAEMRRLYRRIIDGCGQFTYVDRGLAGESSLEDAGGWPGQRKI